ncbi:hypothetical protein [Streptomyces ipomoeae]|uniref:hypothetical protein n=1 Tax=Streptomyces ipomoeae TaxID=103232 RepID=UPI0011468826|nr:hypothetical protein [Streptomyces ipomoeae]MDX2933044.1 hypothetical protein [Streptomyces ipomoeae]TQE16552.1 hypothetical protein SipoB123_40650 [Streptomyces ipomoeae]
MSNTTPPPPAFPPPAPPPPKRNRTNAIIIGSAAAIIATIITTGIVVVQTRDDASPPATTAKSSAPEDDAVTTAADEPDPDLEPEPTYAEVDADSFTIKLRTTERQCFGSAGCNVTVEPKLTYVGIEDLDPDAVYEITYEIRGDESGPVIETAELTDQTSLNYSPSMISTASASTKVSVKITDVVSQGG